MTSRSEVIVSKDHMGCIGDPRWRLRGGTGACNVVDFSGVATVEVMTL